MPKIIKCKRCGKQFISQTDKVKYCEECRQKFKKYLSSPKYLKHRAKQKRLNKLGSVKPSYLKKLENNDIAIEKLMKKRVMGYVNSSIEISEELLEQLILDMINPIKGYCEECGGKLMVARKNEYYTKTEIVCSSCGLVADDLIL